MKVAGFGLGTCCLALLAGCPPEPEPVFAADFRQTYQKVLDCETSADHALMNVIIWADDRAAPAYADGGTFPLPEGATVVKEEFADTRCEELQGYSVMQKDAAKEGAEGWHYQGLDARRAVTDEGAPQQCASCHRSCGAQSDQLCGTPR